METANSWPRSCACEASVTVVKADIQTMRAAHQALKLRTDRTESRIAELFADLLTKERSARSAVLFEEAIAGERRRAQADSCRGQSLVSRVGEINAACCSGGSGGRHRLLQDDTSGSGSHSACGQLPSQCSASCAPVFIAFKQECEEMIEEAGFDMRQVEMLHERCLEQVSIDEGSCGAQIGRRILQRADSAAGTMSGSGATVAMIIPLTILTNEETGMLEVLAQSGRRNLQAGGAQAVHEFRCECGSSTDISNCIPVCDPSIHGFELLLTIDQSDIRVSCKLHAGLYSWAGAVSEGSYFGDDDELFISILAAGAEGRYHLTLRVSPGVRTQVAVQRNQEVQIFGDRALPAAPAWGSGGFVVKGSGSLALEYITLVGGVGSSAPLSVAAGGLATVVESVFRFDNTMTHQAATAASLDGVQAVALEADATLSISSSRLQLGEDAATATPLPCDGVWPACDGPHNGGAVTVAGPSAVTMGTPLVCEDGGAAAAAAALCRGCVASGGCTGAAWTARSGWGGCGTCAENWAGELCDQWTGPFPLLDEYVGCFADYWSATQDMPRDMPSIGTAVISLTASTPEEAVVQCSMNCAGFRYLGLQWTNQCFCGNSYGRYGEASGCDNCGIGLPQCGVRNAVYTSSGDSGGRRTQDVGSVANGGEGAGLALGICLAVPSALATGSVTAEQFAAGLAEGECCVVGGFWGANGLPSILLCFVLAMRAHLHKVL